MKVIKISEETHKYLMMQRALTGVPAGRQIDELVKEKKYATEGKDTTGKILEVDGGES